MSISWPPIAFSSSRTIWLTFSWTRHPSGRKVQRPAPTWRMKPPRTSSWWLTASASAGGSRSVGIKSLEARKGPSLRGALGRFGHHQSGRLGQLQARRALHPAFDPPVDLVEELIDEDVRGDLLQHTPVGVDETGVAPAGDAEVGVTGLPRPVHGATHDRDFEGLWIVTEALLDLLSQRPDADVVPPARGARDHDRAALTQPERLEDLPGDLDLLHRVCGEGDADRVADSVHEKGTDTDRALDRP